MESIEAGSGIHEVGTKLYLVIVPIFLLMLSPVVLVFGGIALAWDALALWQGLIVLAFWMPIQLIAMVLALHALRFILSDVDRSGAL